MTCSELASLINTVSDHTICCSTRMFNFKKKLDGRRMVIITGYTITLSAAVSASPRMQLGQCYVGDIVIMTEQDRTQCTKLPLNVAKFPGPFFTPKILKGKTSMKQVFRSVSSAGSLVLSR